MTGGEVSAQAMVYQSKWKAEDRTRIAMVSIYLKTPFACPLTVQNPTSVWTREHGHPGSGSQAESFRPSGAATSDTGR